ncbi:MAG TPA: hypothetical protein VHP57_04995, partial [Acidimicrobiia bacterium]|nr:hypothetical protein [Acidimicrobiia bacterium]
VATQTLVPAAALAALCDHGIVARVADHAVVCDLRSVHPDDDNALGDALHRVASTARAATPPERELK